MSSPHSTDQQHEAIRRALAHRHRDDSGSGAIAVASLGLWREVNARLAPMIGARGVDALFGRSLQLTTPAYPWLALAVEQEDSAAPLASLAARLEARDPRTAAEASVALLAAFTGLLATMIGPSLTDRMLDPVWGPAPEPPAAPKETTP